MTYITGNLHYWNASALPTPYGFVVDARGIRYFAPLGNFLPSEIKPQLGVAVRFLPGQNHRGLVATNIEVVPGLQGGAK
jgi:hypothetical protein